MRWWACYEVIRQVLGSVLGVLGQCWHGVSDRDRAKLSSGCVVFTHFGEESVAAS